MYLQKESLSYGEYMTNVIFLLVDGLSIMVKKKKKKKLRTNKLIKLGLILIFSKKKNKKQKQKMTNFVRVVKGALQPHAKH